MIRTLIALLLTSVSAHAACGPDPAPCVLPEGTYHIALPHGSGPYPAVVFLHGWGGTGAGTLKNTGMVNAIVARGYAVIAPDGQPRPGQTGRSWDFYPGRSQTRDEVKFLSLVAEDAALRFGLIRDHMLLAGFSIGGSMTSYAACADPTAFAAYAPISGSFWRPAPDHCAGPVRLLHTHGWADQTVPLEGREVAPGFAQGDVFAALDLWRKTDGCQTTNPDRISARNGLQTRSWTRCTSGADLTFILHPGGHMIPKGWASLALDWFEAKP